LAVTKLEGEVVVLHAVAVEVVVEVATGAAGHGGVVVVVVEHLVAMVGCNARSFRAESPPSALAVGDVLIKYRRPMVQTQTRRTVKKHLARAS